MGVTYRKADAGVMELVAAVIDQTFPHLKELGVAVDVLVAHAARDKEGRPKGPAVKLHGVACLATIQVTSLKDRVAGLGDCRIVLDADRWDDLDDARRRALIDHELTHLVPQLDAEGGPKTDDAFRPCLKLRTHDFDLGGFWSVVERHKAAAPEGAAYAELHRGMTQRVFPWG